MDIENFASVILFHRKKSGLSRAELSRLAGVGKTVVFDIERGKPTVQMDTFMKVLSVLNLRLVFSGPLMPLFEKETLLKSEPENVPTA